MEGTGNVGIERTKHPRQEVGTRVHQFRFQADLSAAKARFLALSVGNFGSDTRRPSTVAHLYQGGDIDSL